MAAGTLNGSDEPIAIHRKIGSARPRKASSSSSSSSSSLLSPPQADAKGMEEYRSDKRKSRHTTAGQSEKSHDGATIMSPTPTTGRGDGSVDKQSDPSHDLSRTGLEGGDKGKGKRKWTGREDRGSSSESIPEDSGEDGKAAPVERPEQGNEMKEGHPVEEERAALSHVDDDDIGYDERVPPSLPAFEEPRPPLVGEHENHEDGVDVDMGLSDERREKQPRPSVGGEDHREAAHEYFEADGDETIEATVQEDGIDPADGTAVEDDQLVDNSGVLSTTPEPFSPSRKKQGDAAQRNKKKKRRRRTGQSSKNSTNSSDEYSDVDTRNGAYGHHGDFLPKRPARSTRSAALLSASAFRRPTPPPATMEQPFEIDCDEGNDEVEAADGDGADQDDASAARPSGYMPKHASVSTVSSEEGPGSSSGDMDSSMVATDFGDGIIGVRTRQERKGAMPGIRKVHLTWATAYLNQGSIRKVPHETRVVYRRKGAPGAVEVTREDVIRLQETVFLNDTLIDFYLRYLLCKPDSFGGGLTASQIHVFSPLVVQAIANASYSSCLRIVKKWTKGVKLFRKKLVFFPINSCLHWSLVVLCNPDRFTATRQPKSIEPPQLPHTPPPSPTTTTTTTRTTTITTTPPTDRSSAHAHDVRACPPTQRLAEHLATVPRDPAGHESDRMDHPTFMKQKEGWTEERDGASIAKEESLAKTSGDVTEAHGSAYANGQKFSPSSESFAEALLPAEETPNAGRRIPPPPSSGDEGLRQEVTLGGNCERTGENDYDELSSANGGSDGGETELEDDDRGAVDGQLSNEQVPNGQRLDGQTSNGHMSNDGQLRCDEQSFDQVEATTVGAREELKSAGQLIGGGRRGKGRANTPALGSRSRGAKANVVGSSCCVSVDDDDGDEDVEENDDGSDGPSTIGNRRNSRASRCIENSASDESLLPSPAGHDGGSKDNGSSPIVGSSTRIGRRHGSPAEAGRSETGGPSRLAYRGPDPDVAVAQTGRAGRQRRACRSDTPLYAQSTVSGAVGTCSLQSIRPSRVFSKRPVSPPARLDSPSVDGNTAAGTIDPTAPADEVQAQARTAGVGPKSGQARRSKNYSPKDPLESSRHMTVEEFEERSPVRFPERSSEFSVEGVPRFGTGRKSGDEVIEGKRCDGVGEGADGDAAGGGSASPTMQGLPKSALADASGSNGRINNTGKREERVNTCSNVSSEAPTAYGQHNLTGAIGTKPSVMEDTQESEFEDLGISSSHEPEPFNGRNASEACSDKRDLSAASSDQPPAPATAATESKASTIPNAHEIVMPEASTEKPGKPAVSSYPPAMLASTSDRSEAQVALGGQSKVPAGSSDHIDTETLAVSTGPPVVTKRKYSLRQRTNIERETGRPEPGAGVGKEELGDGADGDGGEGEEVPCMLMLDSTKGHRSQEQFKVVRKYVAAVWKSTRQKSRGAAVVNASTLPGYSQPVPLQSNDCDCGVHVIHYVRLILRNPPKVTKGFLSKSCGSMFSNKWFDESAIKEQRREIRNAVETVRWEALQQQRQQQHKDPSAKHDRHPSEHT